MQTCRRDALALQSSPLLLPMPVAWATDYPAKPVRIVAATATAAGAGAGADFAARMLADQLSAQTKQQYLVENRPVPAASSARWQCRRSRPRA